MIRIVLAGACGRMGNAVQSLVGESALFDSALAIDPKLGSSFADQPERADVVIDFSTPAALMDELAFCRREGLPLVLATTGHGEQAEAAISEASESIAILQSGNFSYGAYALNLLAVHATSLLQEGYDITILETHHQRKKDAPSGTAKQLAAAMGGDIPMLSVRGGGVIGVHEVLFLGDQELLTIKHEALDRRLFAKGALEAAAWLARCSPGLYSMADFFERGIKQGKS